MLCGVNLSFCCDRNKKVRFRDYYRHNKGAVANITICWALRERRVRIEDLPHPTVEIIADIVELLSEDLQYYIAIEGGELAIGLEVY